MPWPDGVQRDRGSVPAVVLTRIAFAWRGVRRSASWFRFRHEHPKSLVYDVTRQRARTWRTCKHAASSRAAASDGESFIKIGGCGLTTMGDIDIGSEEKYTRLVRFLVYTPNSGALGNSGSSDRSGSNALRRRRANDARGPVTTSSTGALSRSSRSRAQAYLITLDQPGFGDAEAA